MGRRGGAQCVVGDTLAACGAGAAGAVCANALKTIDHRGGLDAFLAKAKEEQLAPKALELKRQIAKKRAAG